MWTTVSSQKGGMALEQILALGGAVLLAAGGLNIFMDGFDDYLCRFNESEGGVEECLINVNNEGRN